MKTIISAATLALFLFFTDPNKLTGRWETKPSSKGNVTTVLFRADSTFEGYINKKAFTSGKYSLDGDIFSFTDNGCGGVKGVYKLIFFSNSDSVRFETISDSCAGRKAGMERTILGRVK